MAWASVSGAIDYTTDDGSALFKLRERTILSVMDAKRRYEWSCQRANRHATLARGTNWLTNDGSAKVSSKHMEGMEDAEDIALEAAFPYQERTKRDAPLSKDVETAMQEAYVREFGGLPGSPEAEAAIALRKADVLPSLKRKDMASPASVDAAAVRSAEDWAHRMRPRRRHE